MANLENLKCHWKKGGKIEKLKKCYGKISGEIENFKNLIEKYVGKIGKC